MAFSRSKTTSLVRSRFNQWEDSTPFEPIYEHQNEHSIFVNNSLNFVLFVISHVNFIVNGKNESVPRDQVFPFLDVYCSLLLQKGELYNVSFIHMFLPAISFFNFEIFSTRIWSLPFAVNVALKLSIVKLLTSIEYIVVPGKKLKNWSSAPFRMEWKRCTHSACYLGIFLEIQDLSGYCLLQSHIL